MQYSVALRCIYGTLGHRQPTDVRTWLLGQMPVSCWTARECAEKITVAKMAARRYSRFIILLFLLKLIESNEQSSEIQ